MALLGLVAFSALTDFSLLPPGALALAAAVSLLALAGQASAPIWGHRALRGSAATASAAALGAAIGFLVPIPGFSFVLAISGAVLTALFWRPWQVRANLRGVAGTAGGCLVAIAADGIAVVAQGGILGLSVWWHGP